MESTHQEVAGFRGQVNMDALLQRKPLHPAELRAVPSRVCVTGEHGWRAPQSQETCRAAPPA